MKNSTTRSRLRLPRSVEVAGCRVQIRVRDLEDTFGQYWPDDRLIEIDRTHLRDSPAEALLTLRHELMEASLYLTGIGWARRYDQEPIVRAMEQVFFPAWEKVQAGLKRSGF